MKKVLVTGANGYIGQHVVKEALDRGFDVVACDISNTGIDSRATFVNEDIFSNDENLFEKLGKPDVCIHMAWRDGFVHNSPAHMKYLSGHYDFVLNMVEAGCKNIAVMGTMHEIGYWEGKIDENTPCNPLSQYGVAKNALRQSLLLEAKAKEFNLFWLRAYYILGDDVRNHSIFTKILEASKEGKKEFPFTSGKNKYDFVEVDELAKMIVAASTQEKYTGIINVCSGNSVSLADRVEQYIKDKNLDIKLNYGAFPDRAYDSPEEYGDNTIIQKILEEMN